MFARLFQQHQHAVDVGLDERAGFHQRAVDVRLRGEVDHDVHAAAVHPSVRLGRVGGLGDVAVQEAIGELLEELGGGVGVAQGAEQVALDGAAVALQQVATGLVGALLGAVMRQAHQHARAAGDEWVGRLALLGLSSLSVLSWWCFARNSRLASPTSSNSASP